MTTSRGWMKGVAIGCAAVAALVIVLAGVLVAVNWSTVKGSYRRASSAVGAVMHVMSAVQSKYGGAVAVNVRSQTGVNGAVLSLTLTNPPLLEQLDPETPAAKEKAREIATTARDALPVEGRYEHYEIVFARSEGSVVNVSRRWVFQFDAVDLAAK